MKRKSKGKDKGKRRAFPGGERANSGNGGFRLKYPFPSLNRGQSLTIEGADQKAGGVTVRENVRRLAYEFGLRSNRKFRVTPIQEGKCIVKRIK